MKKKRDSGLFIDDISYNIGLLEEFTKEGKIEFNRSVKTQMAVIKCIENIGEAIKNLDDETKNIVPHEEWSAISKTRDFFAHHYFGIDTELVWEIAQQDIPSLKSSIEKIIAEKRLREEKQKQQTQKNPPHHKMKI
jgi:uncharacterized protein with HEPN domain